MALVTPAGAQLDSPRKVLEPRPACPRGGGAPAPARRRSAPGVGSALGAAGWVLGTHRGEPPWGRSLEQGAERSGWWAGRPRPAPAPAPAVSRFQPAAQVPPGDSAPVRPGPAPPRVPPARRSPAPTDGQTDEGTSGRRRGPRGAGERCAGVPDPAPPTPPGACPRFGAGGTREPRAPTAARPGSQFPQVAGRHGALPGSVGPARGREALGARGLRGVPGAWPGAGSRCGLAWAVRSWGGAGAPGYF